MRDSVRKALLVAFVLVVPLSDAADSCPPINYLASDQESPKYLCLPCVNNTYETKCKALVHCKENYYYGNKAMSMFGQIFSCESGIWRRFWSANPIAHYTDHPSLQPEKCLLGCPALSDADMANATYVEEPSKSWFRNRKQIIWPVNTQIKTKCKEGFIFEDEKFRKGNEDNFVCWGGSKQWQHLPKSGKPQDGYPARCEQSCVPMQPREIPSSVRTKTDPTSNKSDVLMASGSTRIKPGSAYTFECVKGFSYPEKGKTEQKVVCRKGEYHDNTTGEVLVGVQPCIRSDECMKLSPSNIDKAATISYENCDLSKDSLEGCAVLIKCNTPSYMEKSEFSSGQRIHCLNGSWLDSVGKSVKFENGTIGEACLSGCRVPATEEMINATTVGDIPKGAPDMFYNGKLAIYRGGYILKTKCQPGYAKPIEADRKMETNSYECIPNEGWRNAHTNGRNEQPGRCDPACLPLPDEPEGTQYDIAIARVASKKEDTWLIANSAVNITCKEGYIMPGSTHKDGMQRLICKGGSRGWFDPTTNKNNAIPLSCLRKGSTGCVWANQPTLNVTKKGECTVSNGFFPLNCKLEINCIKGYSPSVKPASNDGNQRLECKKNGWVDLDGGKNEIISCIAVCDYSINEKRAKVDSPPISAKTTRQYATETSVLIVKCQEGFVVKNEVLRTNKTLVYKCAGGNQGWSEIRDDKSVEINAVPGDSCVATCDPLLKYPEGAVNVTNPEVFLMEGKAKVSEGSLYIMKCKEGFAYPSGSPEAQLNMQKLVCKGREDGYIDERTGKKGSVTKCEKGRPSSGCSPFDVSRPPKGLFVLSHQTCKLENGKTSSGCQMKLRCEEGFYPADVTMRTVVNQSVECKKDNWFDLNKKQITPLLSCVPGCKRNDLSPNADITKDGTSLIKYAEFTYYEAAEKIIVKCKPDAFPKDAASHEKNKEMEYSCRGGNETIWQNLIVPGFENRLGDQCVKMCKSIHNLPVGVIKLSGPSLSKIENKEVVLDGQSYSFKCVQGYQYDKKSVYSKTKSQELVCDGATGNYLDATDGKKTNAAVAGCTPESKSVCADIPQENARVSNVACPPKTEGNVNCNITITCDKGYLIAEPYRKTGKQILNCRDGKEWIDQQGKVITTKLPCSPVCEMKKASGAEIIDNKATSSNVGSVTSVDSGVFIGIKCSDEGVVWELDRTKSKEPHKFLCVGGSNGWLRKDDNKGVELLGEGCKKTCSPLKADIPSTVKLAKKPDVIENGKKQVVLDGEQYTYTCINDKHEYPVGSKQRDSNEEVVQCSGDTKSYININSGQPFEALSPCIRRSDDNECKRIDQDLKRVIVGASECEGKDGAFYAVGCIIPIRCQKGYYPTDPVYQTGTGEQLLTCGSGGSGWLDQRAREVVDGLNCTEGCVEEKVDVNNLVTILKSKMTYVAPDFETIVECSSQNITRVKRSANPFACSAKQNSSESTYSNKECTNACPILPSKLPTGVVIDKMPLALEDRPYVFAKETYVFKCAKGYVYPKGTKSSETGFQNLVCNGTSREYDDPDTSTKGASPIACVEAKGCAAIVQPKEATTRMEKGCWFSDGFYNDRCNIVVNCINGFYPENKDYLYSGGQKIMCDENKNQSWFEPNTGKAVQEPIKCLKGCRKMDVKELVSFMKDVQVENMQDLQKEKTVTVYDDGNDHFYSCASEQSSSKVTNIMKKVQDAENRYFCDESGRIQDIKNQIEFEIGACSDSCSKRSFQLPSGVVLKKLPFSYTHGGVELVGSPNEYVLACDKGWSYPKNAVYSKNGEQKIRCLANNSYIDVDTNKLDPEVASCTRVLGCQAPDKGSTSEVVEYDAGCHEVAGHISPNCTLTISCAKGHFPKLAIHRQVRRQTVKCDLINPISAAWKDNKTDSEVESKILNCILDGIIGLHYGSDETNDIREAIKCKTVNLKLPLMGTSGCVSGRSAKVIRKTRRCKGKNRF